MSITVIINSHHTSHLIDKVRASVKDFDEVIECDMEQDRNYAISSARNEWVLVIDDDELVPTALRRYLNHYIRKKHTADGLYIPRRNYMMDRFMKNKYPDYRLRFMRRDNATWEQGLHNEPVINGEIGKIPSNRQELALVHLPHTISMMVSRLNQHTTEEMDEPGKQKVTVASISFKPLARFINAYLFKGAFRYGVPGFISAFDEAVYETFKQAKRYEETVKFKLPADVEEGDRNADVDDFVK